MNPNPKISKLINQTKKTCLAEEVAVADTVWLRMRGLLGKKELKKGQTLVLNPCNSVHTFFMRFPIDVVFVSTQNRVVKTISSLKPFRHTGIYFRARFTVELPAGTIQETLTREGDTLSFL